MGVDVCTSNNAQQVTIMQLCLTTVGHIENYAGIITQECIRCYHQLKVRIIANVKKNNKYSRKNNRQNTWEYNRTIEEKLSRPRLVHIIYKLTKSCPLMQDTGHMRNGYKSSVCIRHAY